jgi:hypothetical protein
MRLFCTRAGRLLALLWAVGALALTPGRPAHAGGQFSFQQVMPLEEAHLRTIDVFDAYWWFDGKLRLDVQGSVDGYGKGWAAVTGVTHSVGRNYKNGYYGRMEIFFHEVVPVYLDAHDGVLRAKVPFLFTIRGPGGGQLPSQMRLAISNSGVKVSGVTLGVSPEEWPY